ncbi:malonate decarboxylase holo-[acyl-carrier-protein] synthase (plasmid) [Cereibacter sphaeroides]|uniref:malonate decarboxylase holo-[acyl-carrier-protein] synthase n=1 Tax=Cereibacter sphaeroides TaxID=1063 RepID=UPI000F52796F|nr:malonate decarboxylase holo-[acyl-carrier-protein] synthase [Cereibacter sphaeroides]AZB57970.1 malonate decarboxylase holo-[acyl-carrier-protein] synthase [Cereibacter sphaeroides]
MLRTRHTLAYVSESARWDLLPAVIEGLPAPLRDRSVEERVREVLMEERIPGIVCRPTRPIPEGGGQIGFAFPFRIGALRVRSSVAVHRSQIEAFVTPWEVMASAAALKGSGHPAVEALRRLAEETGAEIGLLGSVALQTMTGLDYIRPDSDLDIIVRADGLDRLTALGEAMAALARRTGIRIDTEVELDARLGVKLEELLSETDSVLGKTIASVELISRRDLRDLIARRRSDATCG